MMTDYCVYMHENRINGKRYIGITSDKPENRWQNGHGYYKNKHFCDAIKKYGWDSFRHSILFSGLTKDQACFIERRLIKEYNTQDKRFGYNITDGGEHFRHSEESKELMSRRRKGKGIKPFTEEHKRKLKENHAGGADARPVFCVEKNITFKSINDASRFTGINKKGISGCCRNLKNYNTAGGYHWRFV